MPICPRCEGYKVVADLPCGKCRGDGIGYCEMCNGGGWQSEGVRCRYCDQGVIKCPGCSGLGTWHGDCPLCLGAGAIPSEKVLEMEKDYLRAEFEAKEAQVVSDALKKERAMVAEQHKKEQEVFERQNAMSQATAGLLRKELDELKNPPRMKARFVPNAGFVMFLVLVAISLIAWAGSAWLPHPVAPSITQQLAISFRMRQLNLQILEDRRMIKDAQKRISLDEQDSRSTRLSEFGKTSAKENMRSERETIQERENDIDSTYVKLSDLLSQPSRSTSDSHQH